MMKKWKKNLYVGVRAISDFEQGYISNLMEPFKLKIAERTEDWIVFEGKVSLPKATRILSFLREKDFEFYMKGERA